MIIPPGVPGVAFGTRNQGDGRVDSAARASISSAIGIPTEWATVRQVHGKRTVPATQAMHYGAADGLMTQVVGLPLVIATADCVPVVLIGDHTRTVAHAGWRGVAAGVVSQAVDTMRLAGDTPHGAILGPHICDRCYEVGPEVNDAIGGFESETYQHTNGADLAGAIIADLDEIPVVDIGVCTYENSRMASYRLDGTRDRQVTVVWIPQD